MHPQRIADINIEDLISEVKDIPDHIASRLAYARHLKLKIQNKIHSTLLYCLGLTDEIPKQQIKRIGGSLPDIDLDFEDLRRNEVISYLKTKYGNDCVSQIATLGTMKAKGAIRDVTRVLGQPYDIGNYLADLTLEPIHGKPQPLEKSISEVLELRQAIKENPTSEEILKYALKVENSIRNAGVHASGIVISNKPLNSVIPLTVKDEELVSAFEMGTLEDIGLVKFDILGLRTLSIIGQTIKLIKVRHNLEIDIDHIPIDDPKVFSLLQTGNTIGIFQLESDGIISLLKEIKPTSLDDIILLVAAYRPGPLGSEGMKQYLSVRRGETTPKYLLPVLEPILKKTHGWLIYQEQVMRICTDVCGWTLAEADTIRKAVGKKKPELMASLKEQFIKGATKNGHPEDKISQLWDEIVTFAAYSFNLAHAACYGYVAYQTAWLKANYPLEFLCACLMCEGTNLDNAKKYIKNCEQYDIKVLGPCINESSTNFTIVDNKTIRFGLSAIKNLGEDAASSIILARNNNKWHDLYSFISSVDTQKINRKKIESLILSGSLDNGIHTRQAMLNALDSLWEYKEEYKRYEAKLDTYNKRLIKYNEREEERQHNISTGITPKKARLKFPDIPIQPVKPIISSSTPEMNNKVLLGHEKELLGLYFSGHPTDKYQLNHTIASLDKIDISGALEDVEITFTKNEHKEMARAFLSSIDNKIKVIFFNTIYTKYKHLISEGSVLRIKGKLIEADTCIVQEVIPLAEFQQQIQQIKKGQKIFIETLTNNRIRELETDNVSQISFKTQNGYLTTISIS